MTTIIIEGPFFADHNPALVWHLDYATEPEVSYLWTWENAELNSNIVIPLGT